MVNLKAFQIIVNGKILDYRLGENKNLDKIRNFFEKKYTIKKLIPGGRHILGVLEKNKRTLFLKLSTTEGISAVSKNEYNWNEQFNKLVSRRNSNFWVPQNKDCGLYEARLFYLITDRFDGELLIQKPKKTEISTAFKNLLPSIIRFSEIIQELDLNSLSNEEDSDYRKIFLEKVRAWYTDIPKNIAGKYKIEDLLKTVENGISKLQRKPRHGDFTPWHLIKLKTGQLGLIDGEHARKNGVEYYDIGYFIQRVFSVLQNPALAEDILYQLTKRNYNLKKLKVILAARAIGGFLDESLNPSPDYTFCVKFKDWIINNNPSNELIV